MTTRTTCSNGNPLAGQLLGSSLKTIRTNQPHWIAQDQAEALFRPLRPSTGTRQILEAHAEHVRETLQLAASLGRVAIVTLAA